MSTINRAVCCNTENRKVLMKIFYIALMFALVRHLDCIVSHSAGFVLTWLPFCLPRGLRSMEKVLDLEFRRLCNSAIPSSNLKGLIHFSPPLPTLPAQGKKHCLHEEWNKFIQASRIDEKWVSLDSSQVNMFKPKLLFVSFHKTSNWMGHCQHQFTILKECVLASLPSKQPVYFFFVVSGNLQAKGK